jgi:tetratricopeptide (TPR) repeat protein
VTKMVADRPAMAQFAAESDFLRQWAARKFAGEDFGAPIDWDPSSPLHSDAEHTAPGDGDNAAILVEGFYGDGPHKGQPRSFEELWAGAVYELHNVVFAREFVRLNDEADEGAISKTAFVGGIVKYELRAAQRTRAFYLQVFLPWAEKKQLATDPSLWFCDWWESPDTVLQRFADKTTYPWQPYGRTYDWATVHRQWRQGKVSRTLRLLARMRDEKGYEEDLSEVQYWIGRCLARLHKQTRALASFSEAIRLDPDSADAYQARGELYQALGQPSKAAADLAKAKELSADN